MAVFDPNQPLPSFEAQALEIERKRRQAEFLRKRSVDQPEMRMVGRVAVQPHWLERLVPLLNQLQAGHADRQATSAEQDMSNQQSQAADQWRAAMPQPQAAEAYQEGAPNVPGAQEGVAATPAIPARPVDRARILKYTLEGMANPRTAKEAGMVQQSLTADLQRAEDMDFKKEERTAAELFRARESELTRDQQAELKRESLAQAAELKHAQLQFQMTELTARMEDRALNRDQQAVLARQAAELQRQLAANALEMKRLGKEMAGGTGSIAREMAADRLALAKKKDLQDNVDKYGKVTEHIVPMHQSMKAIQDILDSYDNDWKKVPGIGYTTLLPSPARRAEANRIIRQVQTFANAVTRAQAGLSQTLSEQAKVDAELMNTGKFSAKEFMQNWPEIMAKYNATVKHVNSVAAPEALEELRKRGGYTLEEVAAKPKGWKNALPKTTGAEAEQMPAGMDPAKWARLQELKKKKLEGATK